MNTKRTLSNLWGGAIKKELMEAFGIVSLPRDFVMDEKGKLVSDFPKVDSEGFLEFVLGR